MSILKGHPTDHVPQAQPRDEHGRFFSPKCGHCDCGDLRHQGGGFWSCDGLVDPGNPNQELQPCPAFHYDGEPRVDFSTEEYEATP